MSTTFPSTKQTFVNPIGSNYQNSPDHAGQHSDANDTLEALQDKVGIDNSTVITTLDFKVNSRRILNVKEYGAKGDGVTDDTAAIQAAVNAVGSSFGAVYFPPCVSPSYTYLISGTITVPYSIDFIGANKQSSVIKTNSATANMFNVTANYSVNFRHLRFDTAVTRTGGAAIRYIGGDVGANGLSVIEDCLFESMYISVDYASAYAFIINDSYFSNIKNIGVRINNTLNPDQGDSTIYGCQFDTGAGNPGIGIYQESSGGLRVENCKFLGCTEHIFHDILVGNTANLIITGNSFEGATNTSIALYQNPSGTMIFSHIVITGNQFGNTSGNSALTVNGPGYSYLVFNDNLLRCGGVYGLDINYNTYGVIQGNIIENCGTGIIIGGSATYNSWGPNMYVNCGTTVVNNGGTTNGVYTVKMTE